MNQELKNFDMLIVELETTFKNNEYQAFKTLLNIYTDIYNNYGSLQFKDLYRSGAGGILVHHSTKLKLFEKELLENDFPTLVSNGEYKTLHTVQILIDKLKELNYYMEIKVTDYLKGKNINELLNKPFNSNVQYTASKLLNESIENGFLITQITEDLRNSGKTHALINKANELGATIVVGSHMMKRNVDEESRKLDLKIDCQYINDLSTLRGRRMKNNSFLIEDGVPNQIIKELIKSGNKFIGGFNSLSVSTTHRDKTLDIVNNKLNKLYHTRDTMLFMLGTNSTVMREYQKLNNEIEVLEDVMVEAKN